MSGPLTHSIGGNGGYFMFRAVLRTIKFCPRARLDLHPVGCSASLCGEEQLLMSMLAQESCYFQRAPEKLVLEGYRRWMAGFDTRSVAPWEMTWAIYTELLGPTEGRRAMAELSHFVRTLRQCAACPLRSFPFGAHHVCRDECLTLGLIAGLQHGDYSSAKKCLDAMACPAFSDDVCEAAQCFARTLTELDQHLLPIPLSAIEDVLARSTRATVH